MLTGAHMVVILSSPALSLLVLAAVGVTSAAWGNLGESGSAGSPKRVVANKLAVTDAAPYTLLWKSDEKNVAVFNNFLDEHTVAIDVRDGRQVWEKHEAYLGNHAEKQRNSLGMCPLDLSLQPKAFPREILAPADVRVIAENDKGLLFGARIGDRVLTLRCAGKATIFNVCPIDTATWQMLSFDNNEKLWESSGSPVFTVTPEQNESQLLIGEATGASTRVDSFSVDPAGKNVYHSMRANGLIGLPDEMAKVAHARHIPAFACLTGGDVLMCYSSNQSARLTAWRLQQ